MTQGDILKHLIPRDGHMSPHISILEHAIDMQICSYSHGHQELVDFDVWTSFSLLAVVLSQDS